MNDTAEHPTPSAPPPLRLTFYTRPDCPLCERLAVLVEPHLHALGRQRAVHWIERDITTQSDWQARYGRRIPVLEAAGQVLLEGRPRPDHIAAAFTSLNPPI